MSEPRQKQLVIVTIAASSNSVAVVNIYSISWDLMCLVISNGEMRSKRITKLGTRLIVMERRYRLQGALEAGLLSYLIDHEEALFASNESTYLVLRYWDLRGI